MLNLFSVWQRRYRSCTEEGEGGKAKQNAETEKHGQRKESKKNLMAQVLFSMLTISTQVFLRILSAST